MIGSKIADRYEILAELGRGGMGVVYRARDPLLGREVAVKLVPPAFLTPDAEERLQREAQVVAQMDHPAIVVIHDIGRHEGALYFLMPVVAGTPLRSLLRGGSLRLGEILDIGVQVAEALEYSHSRGVVHRDIKPENVMVCRQEGEALRVRVMDFGLARSTTRQQQRLTGSGILVGTLAYLSPEQVGSGEVDGRSDIYSLGTVLYECIVGEPPFSGELQAILYRIAHELPQPPRTLGVQVDAELEEILLRCLAKDPAKRPQRAAELAEGLSRYRARLDPAGRSRPVSASATAVQTLRPPPSPFIGREEDFGELQRRLSAALAGECQLAVVVGEAGVGKTRLLEELERLASVRRIRCLHGRFVERDQAFAYQGLCEVIQDHFRSGERGSSGGARTDFSDVAADLVAVFPALAEIPELRSASTSATKLAEAAAGRKVEDRTQIFEVLARALARIGSGKPLVLLLENLQGADASIDALHYVVRRLGPTPTLVVATYRSVPVERRHLLERVEEAFHDDPRFVSIMLRPFSPDEHRAFVESVLGGPQLAPELVERLYEAAEGNPFFTKELLQSLLGSGAISRDGSGTWRLSGRIQSRALPHTIQQAVEKKIERLPDKSREILRVASILGKGFELRDLEHLLPGEGDLDEALDRLARQGLLEEERGSREDRFAFTSGVLRDVLYAGLARRKRRLLHLRHADHLEKRHAGRLERVFPELVHHFSQADVPDKTVDYGLKLARKFLDAFSPEDALHALRTVVEYVEDEAWGGERSLKAEAKALLALAHRMRGDLEAALKEAEAAAECFEQEGQVERSAQASLLAAETAWQGRRIEATRRWVEKGIVAARAADQRDTLGRLLALGATVASLRGDYAAAKEYLDEAERLGPAGTGAGGEEVPSGGRLVVALSGPVHAIEPAAIATVEEQEVLLNVFETLLATDAEGNLIPQLCERWEPRDGGRSWLLTLRRDVRFHDGHTLTAQDVRASFERSIRKVRAGPPAAFSAISGAREYLSGQADHISGLIVLSEEALEIRLAEALPILPALLSDSLTAIARAPEGPQGADSPPVGTGPFRPVAQDPKRAVLERNPGYWRGAPLLDAVEFRPSLTAAEIAAGLHSGELDLGRDLLPSDLDAILRDPRFRAGLAETPQKNVYFVVFNCSGPLGRSAELRRALAGLVRSHDLVWRTLGRFAQPAVGVIPPGLLGHDAGRRTEVLDRDQARELLEAAGLLPPVRLAAAIHPLLQDRYGSLLRALCEVWSQVGVEIEPATPSMESYLRAFEHNDGVDLMIGRWNVDYSDPDNFTYALFHSQAGVFRSYFSSAETDRLAEEARAESRASAREPLYRRFEELLLKAGAVIPLFHDIDYRIGSPKVRHLRLRSSPPYVDYSELGKVEPRPARAVGKPGGTIHVPIAGTLESLDPAPAGWVEESEILPNVFETLTRDTEEARIVPWLASEFHVEERGRRFRFRLRDDVRFHDGRRLTARDVRYSYERLLRSRTEPSHLLLPITGAKSLIEGQARDLEGFHIHSVLEFAIELEKPISFFPALLSYVATAILPEGSDPSGGDWREACIGTGPFRVLRFEPGRRLELERNPSYWRAGYPKSESLVFHLRVAPETILSEFRAGRFQVASDLFPQDANALRQEFASGYRETPCLSTYAAAFNVHRGPLSSLELRRAVAAALDVDALVNRTLGRLAVPAHGLIPPGLLGHDPTHRRAGFSSAAPEARERPEGAVELTAAVHPVYLGEYADLSRGLWEALERRGVRIRAVNEDLAGYQRSMKAGEADIVLGRWGADYSDADTFVYGLLHTRDGFWGHICGGPEIDELVESGRAETDCAVRHAVYRRIEEILVRDVRLLPLFHEQVYRIARPELEGLRIGFSRPVVAYEDLSAAWREADRTR